MQLYPRMVLLTRTCQLDFGVLAQVEGRVFERIDAQVGDYADDSQRPVVL